MEAARNNTEQARQIFAGAQNLKNVVSATRFLAVIARDQNQLDEAATRAEEALLLARKTGNLGLISSCARTFASIRLQQKKLDDAQKLIDEARAIDAKTGSVPDRIASLGTTGEILEARGNNEKALEAYEEAVKLVESIRSTAASEEAFADVKANYRPYERIVRVLIKLNKSSEAFDYLNRAKSKKLQDSLRLSSVKSGDKATQELLDRANDLTTRRDAADAQLRTEQAKPEAERDKARIENLQQVVASTEGEYRRVFEQIKSSNPNWEKFMTVNPKSLKATQRGIPSGVMLVQYAPLGDQLTFSSSARRT
jgi:tetratricopeptide (TPR) repeat protein